MIELIETHEPTREPLRPSFVQNGVLFRLTGYVESRNGSLIGKYEPVIEYEKPQKTSFIERFLNWLFT